MTGPSCQICFFTYAFWKDVDEVLFNALLDTCCRLKDQLISAASGKSCDRIHSVPRFCTRVPEVFAQRELSSICVFLHLVRCPKLYLAHDSIAGCSNVANSELVKRHGHGHTLQDLKRLESCVTWMRQLKVRPSPITLGFLAGITFVISTGPSGGVLAVR